MTALILSFPLSTLQTPLQVAERLSIRQESSERLLTVVVSRLQSATGSEGEHLACALLEWAVLDRGLAAARKIYTRCVLRLLLVPPLLFVFCHLEKAVLKLNHLIGYS